MLLALTAPARADHFPRSFTVSWTNNLLTAYHPDIPGGKLEIWYLEAFCRKGAHDRDWRQTTVPHRTRLIASAKHGHQLRFLTTVEPRVEVAHDVRASRDEIDFRFTLKNLGDDFVDMDWFQPACIRVNQFTDADQAGYTARSFIFTERGLNRLADTRRTEEARYRGGQVYVPASIPNEDANPRPLCLDRPVNGLIGCESSDGRWLLATASSHTHELFEGVYVCLHSDPHIGGLRPRETKRIRAKLYFLPNDPNALLKRYRRDFSRDTSFR